MCLTLFLKHVLNPPAGVYGGVIFQWLTKPRFSRFFGPRWPWWVAESSETCGLHWSAQAKYIWVDNGDLMGFGGILW